MLLNMGPQHPSTTASCGWSSRSPASRSWTWTRAGYLHRGVEKIAENSDFHHIISQLDPLEYISSLFCEWSPVMSFEKLLDVQVPRRAEYIRVLTGELKPDRQPHALPGLVCLDLGGITPILWSFAERDEIMEMLAAVTGAKLLFNLLPDRRRQRRPEPRVHEPPGRLDGRAGPSSKRHGPAQRERDLRPAGARGWGSWIARRPANVRPGPNLRASGVPFTSAARTRTASTRSSSSTSRPATRVTLWRATCSAWTRSARASGSSTSACTRCPTGPSWRACRASSARARAAHTARWKGPAGSTPAMR